MGFRTDLQLVGGRLLGRGCVCQASGDEENVETGLKNGIWLAWLAWLSG